MGSDILTTHAIEESTYVITCAFTDEDGDAVAPATLKWSLTDEDGTVINDLSQEEISSPSSIETIVLHGDDLQILTGETAGEVLRVLTIEGTYNSSLGTGLELKDEVRFIVDNLVKIS